MTSTRALPENCGCALNLMSACEFLKGPTSFRMLSFFHFYFKIVFKTKTFYNLDTFVVLLGIKT